MLDTSTLEDSRPSEHYFATLRAGGSLKTRTEASIMAIPSEAPRPGSEKDTYLRVEIDPWPDARAKGERLSEL